MKIVILDNYDSFTYNLYQYVGELSGPPQVFRNDQITIDQLKEIGPDRLIVSPGPGDAGDPDYFGICREAILELGHQVPILGVCLGHQGIVQAFGGTVKKGAAPMHGKTSYIFHDNQGMFAGLPRAFEVMRYHSLIADPDTMPDCLEITAWTSDNVIMGIKHRKFPIEGVQFHPESVGSPLGKQLLQNFIEPSGRV
ncbi:MAG: aminodeoxychorismate/anthranilate synthase component II [Planctomycetales bacterium]